jgi:hypothetical protein
LSSITRSRRSTLLELSTNAAAVDARAWNPARSSGLKKSSLTARISGPSFTSAA